MKDRLCGGIRFRGASRGPQRSGQSLGRRGRGTGKGGRKDKSESDDVNDETTTTTTTTTSWLLMITA